MKKRIIVEGPHSNFELWVPCVEKLFIEEGVKGGRSMQEFNKIKSLRTGAGLTQDQMAKALGMSVPTYRLREDNRADWKLTEMNAFTDVINKATGANYTIKDIFF